MDWAKSKVVLIIAFLVTNVFLGYNLYANSSRDIPKSFEGSDYREYVDSLLQKKDVVLDAKLPEKLPRLGPVTIKYEFVDSEIFKELLTGKNADLDVVNGKKLLIVVKDEHIGYDDQAAKDYSEEFIKKYSLDKGNMMLKHVKKDGNAIEVTYSSRYGEYFLEKSYMKFYFYPNGDVRIERLWMDAVDGNFQRKEVITPLEAVVKLYAQLDEGSIIEDVRLGYYFNLGEDMKIRNTKTAKAFPAWRITLSDGTEKYVSALDL
ncbi:Two-component signal transduction system YycFG, regulatory protein YycI [Peptoclostridium litorale DSM 5388]|uniref:Regulatory protein YycH-like domain-containing protein n=1 Tax=Peptoclostridium litorale DSM 5388 TaxID=1121324 RepID=A0A069RQ88_PEPLI|nr:two-component system regulatory protein YycI [Peptoclostridium litorale]KDR96342.1 hypothetical protein CLIT_4c01790 [Peptoclostridium litorale DSM 5388]SIO26675.1 Two-component signal transduction system YycFG, regulatory protein YycI [Peptoclostridium litorale DSM 5388]